ncbi:histidine kinase N-terminal 7TM domain-containing protein [Bacillus solitudinis]|uniref:histidine kinase N-terminal 7TM domain-containing protein n=1 Tax=Bacillus solitudinis TaxID=2014074 RepID=UPI001D0D2DCB
MVLLASFMSVASVFELTSSSFQTKIWWRNLQQFPLFIMPIFLYALIMEYLGKD